MNAASESCVTNMTGWITSRDGDFCDAFLQVCLTNEEFEQYSSELSQSVSSSVLASASSSAPSSPSRSARKRHHQAKVAHMRALILSDILEESDAIGGGVSGNGQDDLRKVLIKIILAWAEGCDCVILDSYDEEDEEVNHIAIEFLSQWKNRIDNRPMLSVSLASSSASPLGNEENEIATSTPTTTATPTTTTATATMDQARAFLMGNNHKRDDAWCDSHVAIIECPYPALLKGVEQYCFINSVVGGSMIDFTSGSGLHVKEGVLTIPPISFKVRESMDGENENDILDHQNSNNAPQSMYVSSSSNRKENHYDDDEGDDHQEECSEYMSTMSGYSRQDLKRNHGHHRESASISAPYSTISENDQEQIQQNRLSEGDEDANRYKRPRRHIRVYGIFRLMFLLGCACIAIYSYMYASFLHDNDPYFPYRRPLDERKEFDLDTVAELSVNKTIVITGASAGLGLSSTKILAKAGTARLVVMGCRNMVKCEKAKKEIIEAAMENLEENDIHEDKQDHDNDHDHKPITSSYSGPTLIPMQLDISSKSSIETFANNLQDLLWEYETFVDTRTSPKLDILMNNAGIMCTTDKIQYHDETMVEMQMHVNHLGHFILSHLLLKNLERGGRIVSVSSLAGSLPFHFSSAFSRSLGREIEKGIRSVNQACMDVTGDKSNNHCAMDRKDGQMKRFWLKVVGFVQDLHIYKMFENISSYGASKRANMLFTYGLNQHYSRQGITAVVSHPGYSRTSIMIAGWSFAPEFVKTFAQKNALGSMSSDDGAMSQIRAALDVDNVKADMYVGPLFLTAGKPVIIGSSLRSYHHLFWPIMGRQSSQNNEYVHSADTAIVDDFWKFSEESLK